MPDSIPTPSRLWKRMTPDDRLRAARAFWLDDEAASEHVQAAMLIAQWKKFRAKTVIGLDPDRKARHLASLSLLPDPLAARALVAYHLAEHRPMMGAFLDALGIPHEDGLIRDNAPVPSATTVAPAAAALARDFPPESVALYLNTLLCQDPDTWAALSDVPQRHPS